MFEIAAGLSEPGEVVRKKSLKEEVFELLHQRIVAGRYEPGEWLRQEEIATQLGVSQTPVREALDLLVSVGLAERVPYRGVRVPEPSPEDMIDAYVLRLVLESTAARLAAANITPDQLAVLNVTLENTRTLTRLEDMSRQRQMNKQFHLLIAEAAHNSLLSKMYEMLAHTFPYWRLYEYMFRHPELLETSLGREYQEHRALLEAIAARDGDLAAHQAAAHIRNLSDELVAFLGVPEDLLRLREAQLRSQQSLEDLLAFSISPASK